MNSSSDLAEWVTLGNLLGTKQCGKSGGSSEKIYSRETCQKFTRGED